MGQSVAQQVVVILGGNQEVDIENAVEARSRALPLTVTLATASKTVSIQPAQKLSSNV